MPFLGFCYLIAWLLNVLNLKRGAFRCHQRHRQLFCLQCLNLHLRFRTPFSALGAGKTTKRKGIQNPEAANRLGATDHKDRSLSAVGVYGGIF